MEDVMRKGFTLVQLLITVVVIGVLSGIAVSRVHAGLDRVAVSGAASDVASAFALARQISLTRSVHVAVHTDSVRRSVAVAISNDTILLRLIGQVHGVDIRSNRDSMSYSPLGHGYGAANQTIIISRGGVSDTVVVSRLGRVRYRG
jgi:prepilin-type N-terminal cleavage/methylation domain-containing protein